MHSAPFTQGLLRHSLISTKYHKVIIMQGRNQRERDIYKCPSHKYKNKLESLNKALFGENKKKNIIECSCENAAI